MLLREVNMSAGPGLAVCGASIICDTAHQCAGAGYIVAICRKPQRCQSLGTLSAPLRMAGRGDPC